ncbi:Site-specific recombinase XerD [Bradyrhizobium erythrophlei]|uniref:Site-specific recombinase XerD n=2 Tax=Bradyrhizobium erythrophlei TaxID=1437360 RepID=A0A1M5LIF4_9BRAD|nr:Site-specific recombinase XerD [Bradyrhizobium erythrophlei]
MASIRKHRDKWQVRIRRAGLQPLSKSFSLRKDGAEWARQMEVKADRAELPTDLKALQRITLADLVVRYRDTVSVKKRGYENERISLTAFLHHPICSKRLSDLRTEDFAAYRDQMLQTVKPTSLKRYLDPIHNLFEVARHEWGVPLRDNPLGRLKLKAPSQRRERRLLSGEWERILEAARLCRNPWIEPIIRLALATGMRRGEVLALEDNQIDLERRSLLIRKTKNGHARTIPLTVEAVRILGQLLRGRLGPLFPITRNAFRLAWERLRERADLGDFHFHDLRHEAISRFFELGLNPPEVALISGHRDMRQLFRYTHPLREGIIDKMDRSTS